MKEELEKLPHKVVLDVEAIAKEVGSVRAANIVMLGAAAPLLASNMVRLLMVSAASSDAKAKKS